MLEKSKNKNASIHSKLVMQGTSILVHQTLHGYDDGHRLLRSSLNLSNEAKREMLVLSDLAGQRRGKGFESYVSGYGLRESGLYAMAMTWLAPEMKRPGCVWTHTLLLDFADLSRLGTLQQLDKLGSLWMRPSEQYDRATYGRKLDLTLVSAYQATHQELPENADVILSGLYERPDSPVFVAADDSEQFREFIYLVWLQQWPRLRRAFSFCTGVTSCRRLGGEPFDLQMAPRSVFPSLQREVSNGVFVSHMDHATSSKSLQIEGEKDRDSSKTLWIKSAMADLRGPLPSLRNFLRMFGTDTQKLRGSYAGLVEVFDHVEAVNKQKNNESREDELEKLIETVAEYFPSVKQAIRLKLAIFGTPLPNELLDITEEQMLKALACSPHYTAFDEKSLSMRERASLMWKNQPQQAENLLLHLTQGGLSPLIENLLAGIADVVNAQEALSLFRRNPWLAASFVRRNPSLATSPSLWKGSINLQRELFDALGENALTEQDRGIIAGAVFAADAHSLANQVIERLGASGVQGILDRLEVEPKELAPQWRSALMSQPEVLARWLEKSLESQDNLQRRVDVALQIVGLLHPRSLQVQAISPDFWFSLSKAVTSQLIRDDLQSQHLRFTSNATFFFVALGLDNINGQGYHLIERFFEIVHKDLAANHFDYQAWKWLEEAVPSLPYSDWDKCEKLRRAVIERFIHFKWPLFSLLQAIRHQSTLEFVIRSCQQTKEGEQLLKSLKDVVKDHKYRVPQWQTDILLRRRKKGFSLKDLFFML